MNLINLIGAICALAAVAFGALLLTGDNFVEVFLTITNDETLSPRLAYVGVYESGYDSSVFIPDLEEILTNRIVPTETYTVPTTEFKLLFPSQTEYFKELFPLTPEALAAFPGSEAFGGLLSAATPDFSSCNQYYQALEEGQTIFFSTLGPLIPVAFADLVDLPREAVESVYSASNNSFAGQFVALLQLEEVFVTQCGANANVVPDIGNDLFFSPDFTVCAGPVLNGLASELGANATIAFTAGLIEQGGALIQTAQFLKAVAKLLETFDDTSVTSTCGGGLLSCIFGAADVFPTSALGSPYAGTSPSSPTPTSYCQAFQVANYGFLPSDPCNTTTTALITAGGLATSVLVSQEDLVAQALLTTAGLVKGLSTSAEAYLLFVDGEGFAGNFSAAFASVFPTTFDENMGLCNIYESLGLIDSTGVECNLKFFLEKLPTIIAQSPGADLSLVELGGQLAALYGFCINGTSGEGKVFSSTGSPITPQQCPSFWGSIFVDFTFLRNLDEETYFNDQSSVYEQAKAACLDDEKDISAIETAQIMIPAGVALAGLGGVLGVLSSLNVLDKATLLGYVAGGMSLVGGVMILGALFVVQSAPIYASVGSGEDTNPIYTILYIAGDGRTYGLVALALAVVAGIILLVGTKCPIECPPGAPEDSKAVLGPSI